MSQSVVLAAGLVSTTSHFVGLSAESEFQMCLASSMDEKSTQEKALAINLDGGKLGTFAEIGAGQEVARWFFHVGKAAGTVAKSISAYDMAISDSLYGLAGHYV